MWWDSKELERAVHWFMCFVFMWGVLLGAFLVWVL